VSQRSASRPVVFATTTQPTSLCSRLSCVAQSYLRLTSRACKMSMGLTPWSLLVLFRLLSPGHAYFNYIHEGKVTLKEIEAEIPAFSLPGTHTPAFIPIPTLPQPGAEDMNIAYYPSPDDDGTYLRVSLVKNSLSNNVPTYNNVPADGRVNEYITNSDLFCPLGWHVGDPCNDVPLHGRPPSRESHRESSR